MHSAYAFHSCNLYSKLNPNLLSQNHLSKHSIGCWRISIRHVHAYAEMHIINKSSHTTVFLDERCLCKHYTQQTESGSMILLCCDLDHNPHQHFELNCLKIILLYQCKNQSKHFQNEKEPSRERTHVVWEHISGVHRLTKEKIIEDPGYSVN